VSYVDNGVTLPVPDGTAWAWNHSGSQIATPIVNGRYDFYGLNYGTYSICFKEDNFVALICVGNQGFYDPPNVTVENGQVLDDVDMTVARGGQLVGQLVGTGSPQWEVRLLRKDPVTGSYGNEVDDYPPRSVSGFGFSAVPPGTYRMQVIDTSNANNAQYWNGARYAADATDIVVTTGQTVDLGTITTVARTFDVTRTDGIDRFAVSAGVSQARFATVPADGVPIVDVSNGLNYPDALSAGPAAIKNGGVLLLVTPTAIPAPIATELTRLRPQRIVVVGGPGSVSDGVLHQLDAYVTGPSGKAERLSGIDRFEASRNLARATFLADGAPTVFIATGNNYPDALSAGPAAGSIGAPVILVDGLAPHLDSATKKLLQDLGTTSVDIVGGIASVSGGIQEDLVALVGADKVTIFGGATRYDNAAQLGATFFRYTDTAFFATGTNFPDALSAAALAGFEHAPIDLVQPSCIPLTVGYWIGAQQVQHIWLVGGPASLGQGVLNRVQCSN
jgi:putative cell wall-binding protein